MDDEKERLAKRVEELEDEVASLRGTTTKRTIRKRSEITIAGMPLYDIACGPDPERGEIRGHARGFFAVGDIATGVFALGGLARGVFAFGGFSLGLFSFGGCAIGLLVAAGGAAVGGLALGGAALGVVAIGGAALGFYAGGGAALGFRAVQTVPKLPEAGIVASRWLGRLLGVS
jgi:hypothetical protein